MERLDSSQITPLKFKKNAFAFLKSKMMMLNPGVELNWEDFKMDISRPENIDAQGTITLSLIESARTKYVNPHRTVVFKYTCDVSVADILRNNYNIAEVVHKDDLGELADYIMGQSYNSGNKEYENNGLLPGFSCDIIHAYKTKSGKYQEDSYDSETYETLEEDVNARILKIYNNYTPPILPTNVNNPELMLALLPFARTTQRDLKIVGKVESTATLDFNINGGEFTINTLGITLSEITEQ